MATATKKAPVKATAAVKKAPAKKTPVTVKPRIDYKPGARVKVQLKAGEKKGNVVEVFTKTTGPFIRVNFGTKDMPIIKDVRPVKVKGF